MCCLKVTVEVLMKNLFYALDAYGIKSISFQEVRNFWNFLCKVFPVYVVGNFSKESMEQFLIKDGTYSVCKEFDIEEVNSIYSNEVSKELKRISAYWVKENVYSEKKHSNKI